MPRFLKCSEAFAKCKTDGSLIPLERIDLEKIRATLDISDTDFHSAKIIKDNKEAAEKKDIIQLDDFRKTMKKEGAGKEKETLPERRQKAREQYTPFVNESVNILLDIVKLAKNE